MKVTSRRESEAPTRGEKRAFGEVLARELRPRPKTTAGPKATGKKPGLESSASAMPRSPACELPSALRLTLSVRGENLQVARAESSRHALRATELSERNDLVLGRAHADAARSSREAQGSREEDGLRARLLLELDRQVLPPPPSPPAPEAERGEPKTHTEGEVAKVAGSTTGTALDPAQAQSPTAAARSSDVAALVERIEAAFKNGQASLSVSLGTGAAAAAVQISRAAKGEVRVRIAARAGGRATLQADAQALRAALAARGLKVRALEIV